MAPVVHACPLDCPDSCSLSVGTENGRVSRVTGSSLNPLTNDVICGKVRRISQYMYGDRRVLTPLVRSGEKGTGTFRRASWDQALKRVAKELANARDNFGGESILPFGYGGSNGYLTQDATDATLFRRLGASELARTICAAPSGMARKGMYGNMAGVSLTDYRHANLIVVWGANPHATGIHLVPIIQQACKAGAKLIVVDPRRTKLAKQADLHLAPRPGTDLPLALGGIRWLFKKGYSDEGFIEKHVNSAQELRKRAKKWSIKSVSKTTGIAEDQIETFYQLYADGNPAVIRVGWGPERNRNGGGAIASILALPAIAGKFGVRGGGFTMSNSGAFRLRSDGGSFSPRRSVRTINMNQLGNALLDLDSPPVKALFIYNGNPVSTNPEQVQVIKGLKREDLFTVVFDSVLTDTAKYADVVLPATMFLEHRELRSGYGAMALMDSRPAVEPHGQARSNHKVFAELIDRLGLGLDDDPRSEQDVVEKALDSGGDGQRLRLQLATNGIAFPEAGQAPIQFSHVAPDTKSGKIELIPENVDHEADGKFYKFIEEEENANYPLALLSPATEKSISSTFGFDIKAAVQINPEDASSRQINDGDTVRVFNELGEVLLPAKIDSDLLKGTTIIPKGLWCESTKNGLTSNALTPATLSDVGGGACFNDARVEIEPAQEASA